MLINRLLIISLGFVLGIASASAQGRYSERQLDKRVDQYSFEQAVSGYESLVTNKKHKGPETYLKIANLYYSRSFYKQAVKWYQKAADENPQSFSELDTYRFSHALKSSGQYELSNVWMEQYNSSTNRPFATNTKEIIPQRSNIKLVKLTRSGSDILYPRGYVPDTEQVLVTQFLDNAKYGEDAAFTHTYSFKVLDQKTVSAFEILKGDFETHFNISDAIMTQDGNTLYFSGNVARTQKEHKKAKTTNQYQLFQATKENDTWTNIQPLPFNVEGFSSGHPNLSPNEDWMYFASDRFGGEGEMDLYRVARSAEGSFGVPENLGSTINTPFAEGFPTVVKDTLYFSSKAHTNMGGIDIFYSVMSPNGFSDPVNLGTPINSIADDFAILPHPSGLSTLIASNRVANSDEIFLLEGSLKSFASNSDCRDKMHGQVVDLETRKPIPFATVTTHSENELLEEVQTDSLGNFEINKFPCAPRIFDVVVKSDRYLPFAAVTVSEDMQGTLVLPLDKLKPNNNTLRKQKLNSIYFDLNRAYITDEAKATLDKLIEFLNQYPEVHIAIQSHTDSRASDKYNKELSDQRALRTFGYLVSRGISANRLSRQGFGESQLTNDCHDNADCLEELHKQNRRSEFIITNE